MPAPDIFLVEDTLWVAYAPTGTPAYDFGFEPLFQCRRPYAPPTDAKLVARTGAFTDYENQYSDFAELGFSLVNTPDEHLRATTLSRWYPLIESYTPRSIVFDEIPSVEDVERDFTYPIFIKGERQTAKHKADLCVARSRDDLVRILDEYRCHPVLHWQKLVCREYIDLRSVDAHKKTDKVDAAFEFRTFWLEGQLVGAGPYWAEFATYTWTATEREEALQVASEVCDAVNVPFLVVDLAQTASGQWVCIECNDGQESGYGGVNPIEMWRAVLDVHARRT